MRSAREESREMFSLREGFALAGDQPKAVSEIQARFSSGEGTVVLAGATGTGKSATSAAVVSGLGVPALVLAPNKVLAAQMAAEFRELLPSAFVGFFVSHFAYYRPEAYVPSTDTYIEKDSSIDSEIERLRHEATSALLSRPDVVVVASVSALYGLGRPSEYRARALEIRASGEGVTFESFTESLVRMGYSRNDVELTRGRFRARGGTLDVHPASEDRILRVDFFGDTLESLSWVDPVTRVSTATDAAWVFPVSHHVIPDGIMASALLGIESELEERLDFFRRSGRLLEAQRLEERTRADLESLRATGFCRGVENYSRHFDGRASGDPPACLVDYFPEDFLLVVDESHVTVPQVQAMYEADQSRKRVLVEYGFRLPSALDNRPLSFSEFFARTPRVLAMSATPGKWEEEAAPGGFVDQVVRPTGLVDPAVSVVPQENRMEKVLERIRFHSAAGRRSLVTTVSKDQAETLSEFLVGQGIRARYLHSDVSTVDRIVTLRDLRKGVLEAVVGVNLLREGLDLPEVGLVAILDADSRGFLRSATSLIQTIGRAARNIDGEVLLFADEVTPAMREAIAETNRRRAIQEEFNAAHGITPTALVKAVVDVLDERSGEGEPASVAASAREDFESPWDLHAALVDEAARTRSIMLEAAAALRFEEAAALRDEERRVLLEAGALAEELSSSGIPRPSR